MFSISPKILRFWASRFHNMISISRKILRILGLNFLKSFALLALLGLSNKPPNKKKTAYLSFKLGKRFSFYLNSTSFWCTFGGL